MLMAGGMTERRPAGTEVFLGNGMHRPWPLSHAECQFGSNRGKWRRASQRWHPEHKGTDPSPGATIGAKELSSY